MKAFDNGKLKDLKELGKAFFSKVRTSDRCKPYGLKRVTPAKVTKADLEAAALGEKGGTAKARRLQTALDNGQRHNLGVDVLH